jgi:aminoglycoside phosphotransferase (APT) family kinase protein
MTGGCEGVIGIFSGHDLHHRSQVAKVTPMSTPLPTLLADLGTGTPAAQTSLSVELAQQLIANQFPDLADLPVHFVAEGWDNAMYRVGDDLCARLPRRKIAEDLIKIEQHWLGQISDLLPVPIPAVVRLGKPDLGYPWVWSLVPWLPGDPVGVGRLDGDEGIALGHFLKALHVPTPKNAPVSDCRGGPLSTRANMVRFRAGRLSADFDWIERDIMPLWDIALEAPDDAAPVLLHGDLHPRNVLMKDGKLSAVIDWGDMCGGDPATDLAALWLLLPGPQSRALAIDIYKPSQATLLRAKGWAITWGLLLLDTGRVDNAEHAAIGEVILQQVLLG